MTRFYRITALVAVAALALVAGVSFAQDVPVPDPTPGTLIDQMLALIPAVLALIVPPVVVALRTTVMAAVPARWLPVIVPILSGAVSGLAALLGLDLGITTGDLEHAAGPVWESTIAGLVIGAAGVGVHQIKRQTIDKSPSRSEQL
jgi:hypothetical protein